MDELLEEELQDEPVAVDLDRLTRCALATIQAARKHAEGLGDPFVGTDHLLIGLAAIECGAAYRILLSLNVDKDRVLTAMRFIRGDDGRNGDSASELTFSPRFVRVLESAAKDAAKRNHTELGTLHLLSGLLREREGLAVFLLDSPGIGLARAGTSIAAAHHASWNDDAST